MKDLAAGYEEFNPTGFATFIEFSLKSVLAL
jgi:hypothetical protein